MTVGVNKELSPKCELLRIPEASTGVDVTEENTGAESGESFFLKKYNEKAEVVMHGAGRVHTKEDNNKQIQRNE